MPQNEKRCTMDELISSLAKEQFETGTKILLDVLKEDKEPSIKKFLNNLGTAKVELLIYLKIHEVCKAKLESLREEIKVFDRKF